LNLLKRPAKSRARSSTVEQGTFNPLVPGSNPGGLTANGAVLDCPSRSYSQLDSQSHELSTSSIAAVASFCMRSVAWPYVFITSDGVA
jgi:hypothetical protein